MPARKTDEQILKEVREFLDPLEWEVLGEVRRTLRGDIEVLIQHLICGNVSWRLKAKKLLTRCSAPDCIKEKRYQTNLERFGVEHAAQSETVKEKTRRTNLERFGVENPSQSEVIKEKRRRTNLERFGVENPMQNSKVREKVRQTSLERFGVENPMQSPIIREKARQTNLERYGVEWTTQNPQTREKMKRTSTVNHGVPFPLQSPIIREKIRQTCRKRYGIDWFIQHPRVALKIKESKPNLLFKALLEKNSIIYSREKSTENFRYDFQVDQTLIEINPTVTHNSTFGVFNNLPKSSDYHLRKTLEAQLNNFHCIHVFDWDDPQKIINLLLPKQQIYARQCQIQEVPKQEATTFLNQYHLQNSTKNQKIFLGLYYQNQLVALATFGKPRLNPNYQYELIRLCFHPNYQITGGSEKLFQHFLTQYNPQSIISYCDIAKFSGTVYEKLDFTLLRTSSPTAHWHKLKGPFKGMHVLSSSLRMRGFDILVGRKLGLEPFGKGTSNTELMLRHGFVEVFDCGQQTWMYLNSSKKTDLSQE